jgi:hypothetical protein
VLYTSGATRSIALNTSQGIATTTTPTGGTFGIDYSQQNGAEFALTVASSAGAGNVVTHAASDISMIGNFAKVVSGTNFTVGWFEITAATAGVSFTCTTNQAGTAISTGVGVADGVINIGGAASLQSSAAATDDLFFENGLGTNGSGAHWFFIKNGSYSSLGTVSLAATGGTQAPIKVMGYNTIRTDGLASSLGTNRPTLAYAANSFTAAANWEFYNLNFTGSAASAFGLSTAGKMIFCKIVNSSTTASRNALSVNGIRPFIFSNEFVSYRGRGINESNITAVRVVDNYIHDSDVGYLLATTQDGQVIIGNIIEGCQTHAINVSTAFTSIITIAANTLCGTSPGATPKIGTGINFATGNTGTVVFNNIFTGLTTGVDHVDSQTIGYDNFNDYYNNTTDVDKWQKGPNTIAVDPSFTSQTTVSGSTAATNTSGGNHLTDTNATFSTSGIVAGDIVHITGGTAGPVLCAYSVSSVDSETQLTLGETVVANATTDHTWFINKGHNFLPTGAV